MKKGLALLQFCFKARERRKALPLMRVREYRPFKTNFTPPQKVCLMHILQSLDILQA